MLVRTREGETEETSEEGNGWRKAISSVASAPTFSSHMSMGGWEIGKFCLVVGFLSALGTVVLCF